MFNKNLFRIVFVLLAVTLVTGVFAIKKSPLSTVKAALSEVKLIASDGQASDNFGESVSMTDDYAIIGAPRDDDNGSMSGSAYMFERSGANWAQDTKLTPGDAAANDFFGGSVGIDGNYAIIGASYKDGQGAAYIFYFDGANWGQQTKLTASDAALNDYFGKSVAISGDYAIVGADGNDDAGFSSGSAYIFKRSGVVWTQIKKLTAGDAINGAYFGGTVSIYGDYAIIGAYNADNGGTRSGAAYIFYKDQGGADNWGQIKKLTASDGVVGDNFGASVDIYGNYTVVSATYDDTTVNEAGSAYIFYKDQGGADNWGEFEKLTADDEEFNARMGYSVSISNTRAVVGDWYRNDIGDEDGAIYVYEFLSGSWDNETKIISSDREIGDSFGISVANTDTYIIAGAEREDEVADAAGAAYIFNPDACGDDFVFGAEQCDDGNLTDGDGCSATCLVEFPANGSETKITVVNGGEDRFGQSADIDGDYAVSGATYADGIVADSGAAYIYHYDGTSWTQQAELIASDGEANELFGTSVSISGDYAVVGAFYDDDNGVQSGSAYIYQRSGSVWTQIKKLTASDADTGDHFGSSASIDGDYIIIGAENESILPLGREGAAYIFYKDEGGADNWGQQQKLTASDRANDDYFGISVSVSGDYAFIGASNKTVGVNMGQGAAYAFHRAGAVWSEEFKITAVDGEGQDRFGESVSLNADRVIIGAPNENEGANSSGSAYVFIRNGVNWDPEDKLIANDAAAEDYLGRGPSGVFIDGDFAVAGAYFDDDNGSRSGSAYLFKFNGTDWVQTKKFLASDGAADDYFGFAVSISDDHVISTSDNDANVNGTGAGSAYIYDIDICGDSIVFGIEQCDDGNILSNDGCSATCKMEFLPNENETKVWAFDGADADYLGLSTDVYGDYAIAGSWGDDSFTGSAYIFYKDGTKWVMHKKLTASDKTADDRFGSYVAINSDYAMVGASDEGVSGSAYIFYKDEGGADNWGEVKKITPGVAAADAQFGRPLSINGDYAIIGASSDDANGVASGSAYIFYKDEGGADNWGEVKKLTASDGVTMDRFGGSVSIGDSIAIVGAYGDDDNGDWSGSAYIFYKDEGGADNWGEVKKITPESGAATEDFFGVSSSISGDRVIVGAYGDGDNFGAAYIFYKNEGGVDNWGQFAKLTASDSETDKYLGSSVSLDDDYAIVGTIGDDDNGFRSGAAYIFYKDYDEVIDSWGQLAKITASDGAANDYFGSDSVSISGDRVMAGAYYDDDMGADSGSAYIYELNYCGDGFIYGAEECDDGNTNNGDGCSATCTTESGGSSNPSAPVCGVQPTAMNLPEVIPVSQIGGKPSVGISWSKLDVQEINADQKIQLLFDYFGQIISPTIGENGIKLENVFARYMYDKIMDDAELKASFTSKLDTVIKAGVDLAKCDCIGGIAETVANTVRSMRNVSSIKSKVDNLILGFVNDVLNLERTLKETGQGVRTPFTNFFNRNFANAALEGLIVDVFRDGRLIYTEENPNNTSYTDNSIPLNDTGRVKYYNYNLVSRNNCGQARGSVGKAKIDPIVPAGTAIDTTLDLSIRIKDGYSQLFIDRLREVLNGNGHDTTTVMEQIYEHEDYLAMVNTCSSAQAEFMANKTGDLALEYIIKCYASGNPVLIAKIQERKADIVQPLIKLINLNEGGSGLESLINMFINSVIQNLLNVIETENAVKENIGSFGLNTQTLLLRQRMEDFTQDEKEKIKLLNENLFEGAGHAENLVIEKYDNKNVLLDSYRVRTDVFGEAKGISIGKFISGEEYTIKIRLFDERFVLPKVVKLTLNNAEPTSEGKYKTTVAMNFTKHFRYGDFNEDDTIDLDDIVAWGEVLSGKVPGDGEQYGMFDMWKFGNLDGLAGVNLSDALTLQENWGGLKELTLEEGQMSLSDLLGMFGFTVITAFQSELESGVNVPAWIDIVQTDCRS